MAATETTSFHVSGFTASLLSADTAFQFRVQGIHVSLAERQVMSAPCLKEWLVKYGTSELLLWKADSA